MSTGRTRAPLRGPAEPGPERGASGAGRGGACEPGLRTALWEVWSAAASPECSPPALTREPWSLREPEQRYRAALRQAGP